MDTFVALIPKTLSLVGWYFYILLRSSRGLFLIVYMEKGLGVRQFKKWHKPKIRFVLHIFSSLEHVIR